MKQLYEEENFNLFASNLVSVQRTLPDYRYEKCKKLKYPNRLPATSIIIIFHNEPWTTLLRTIWSIINRSPKQLVDEIILVDDVSDRSYLGNQLEDFIKTLPLNVKLIRTKKREGLIRARLLGAKNAVVSN